MNRARPWLGFDAARGAAWAAFAFGAAYAAVSAYWGLGGTALLGTLGGALEREARSGSAGSLIVVWGAALVKLAAALLPLVAIAVIDWPAARRPARVLSWIAAVTLTLYGLILTAVGLLVQAGVVASGPHPDQRALAWHAFLWDPWFLVWGVLAAVALLAARGRTGALGPDFLTRGLDSHPT